MAYPRYPRFKRSYRRKARKASLAPLVRRIVRSTSEKKFYQHDIHVYGAPVAESWGFRSALAGLVQGTGPSERIGNKIFLHSIRFTFNMKPMATGTFGRVAEQCRCVIYHNKEASGALPTGINDMFTHNGLSAQRFVPQYNKYGVLRDAVHTFTPTIYDQASNTIVLGPAAQWDWVVYPRKQIDFRSNAGTISDLYKDDYGLACVASVSGTGTPVCEMLARVQVIFSDA